MSYNKVVYICGQCLTPVPFDVSDDDGNCLYCGADHWIEKEDLDPDSVNVQYVQEVCEKHGVDKIYLKTMFRPA
jgi:hypothetical protein